MSPPELDECLSGDDTCDDPQRAVCINTPGSFECHCRAGYNGTGSMYDCSK